MNSLRKIDLFIFIPILILNTLSILILNSISPSLFPNYYVYLALSFILFFIFSNIDYKIISFFSFYIYCFSILLLIVVLFVGQATRGAVRWIPLGSFSIQPAEIIRPFLIIFWATFFASDKLSLKRFLYGVFFVSLPLVLILIQPSLGLSILTFSAFLGVLFSLPIDKKKILIPFFFLISLIPFIYLLLAPYQKQRILTFLNPTNDPFGAGYNTIQSMMAVGSGGFFGRGLGNGIQTQLRFLPEKHTDFVFAAIAEEIGFFGVMIVFACYLVIFWRIVDLMSRVRDSSVLAFISGVFFTFLAQVFINIGMNIGLMPVTGITLPLLSAGGSSLLSVMIAFGIINSISKKQ
jgi:rod shape determining protein RodA